MKIIYFFNTQNENEGNKIIEINNILNEGNLINNKFPQEQNYSTLKKNDNS